MKRRNTKSKSDVLALLQNSESALSHEIINEKLKEIDRATIYRVLNRFCEDEIVHKIVGDDGKQYFALCVNCNQKKHKHHHNHFHFRCLDCGKVECLPEKVNIPLPKGYTSESFNCLISGYCDDCS